MKIERYIDDGEIPSLRPILKAWIDNNAEYISSSHYEDLPWYYNERASLSILASAVWTAGGIALEEFSTEKGRGMEAYKGRCDLFIRLGRKSFACECKQAWPLLSSRATSGSRTVKDSLEAAYKDAKELHRKDVPELGICFAVPEVRASDSGEVRELVEEWLAEIKNIKYSCIAWTFPPECCFADERGIFNPGVVMIIKEV